MRRLFALAALAALGCDSRLRPETPPGEFPDAESAVTQVTQGRAGEDKDPELSPDGKTLFFASTSYGEAPDLFMKGVGSNTAVRLTTFPGPKRFPKVNPASPRFVAFSCEIEGEWKVCVLDLESPSKVEVVSEPGSHALHPSWSPDGRFLAYSSTSEFGSGEWALKVRDVAAGRTHVFEDIDGLLPEWSPRDNRIVFQRMKRRDRWLSSIWTVEFEAGAARELTAVFSSDDWAAINPSWSPDGRRIVFATVGKSRARGAALEEADDLWAIDADGSHATRLTTAPAPDWMPTWAADGRVYFVSKRGGAARIWSLEAKW